MVSKRAAERDARKAKAKEKKLHGEKEALLNAIKVSIRDGAFNVAHTSHTYLYLTLIGSYLPRLLLQIYS